MHPARQHNELDLRGRTDGTSERFSDMDILDLRECAKSGMFYGGRAGKKEGIVYKGAHWIAKYPRSSRNLAGKHLPSYTSSPVAEYLGSHLYQMLGIPAHETALAYRGGKIVCACKDFTYPGKRLFMFSELKTEMDDDDDGFHDSPSDGASVYLTDVLLSIEKSETLSNIPGALDRFWDMFVVDALIKNPDRNNGNWGVLMDEDGRYSLAPVYDNGSSFFSKRNDSTFERRLGDSDAILQDAFGTNISVYLTIGDDGKPRHIHPFDYMRTTINADLDRAIERIASAFDLTAFENLVDSVPREAYGWRVLSEPARESHIELVKARYEKGLLPLADAIARRRASAQ